MAKVMTYTTDSGFTCNESYWKLAFASLNTLEKQAALTFHGFASSTARAEMKAPVGTYTCYIANMPEVLDGEGAVLVPANPRFDTFFSSEAMGGDSNIIKQGYLAVMDLPDNPFTDATDVL